MYRIGYPFWKLLARMGVPMVIRVDVLRDQEADVYVATSNDVKGLLCESAFLDDFVKEVDATADELLQIYLAEVSLKPVTDLRLCAP